MFFALSSLSKYSFAACPGDAPAKPVSEVTIFDPSIDGNGNTIISIRVMGYGRDYVKFDGNRINYFEKKPIVMTCNGADGFVYRYNCGKLNPQWGYTIQARFVVSDNFPYNEISNLYHFLQKIYRKRSSYAH